MTLEFEHKSSYGKSRYYASNDLARGVVDLTGRKCLNLKEIQRLRYYGFKVAIHGQSLEEIES